MAASASINAAARKDMHEALSAERLEVQKKTFTKWANMHLRKSNVEIEDVSRDFCDGRKLLILLQNISGELLPKPEKGNMRVHKIATVQRCIDYLSQKVKLENVGAEDIVDGNLKLILGLVWTVILRFQIQVCPQMCAVFLSPLTAFVGLSS
jgi:hypothetical protein